MKYNDRFILDPESGFVYDRKTEEWLTTAEEVYIAMSDEERLEQNIRNRFMHPVSYQEPANNSGTLPGTDSRKRNRHILDLLRLFFLIRELRKG